MRILVIEPLEKPYIKEIDGSLESMQKIVGGLIQAIYPYEDKNVALICNEEAKLIGLPLNRALYDDKGQIYDIIAGTFFLCQAPADSENFESLTDEQINRYKEKYRQPEIYVR
ncbi:MAG: DUF3846 domain-containing protein [Acutalibacteraceae bacterium]|nr:DUF3846 domain-containing protein [Acutalibacteraceae bacterium]